MTQRRSITERIEREVARFLKSRGISHVVIGVSGGADSTALLLLLCRCGVDIEALHCNFHLRGEESDRDAEAVRDLCGRHEVALNILDFDVPAYMKGKGISVEMACRDLRYAEFRRFLVSSGAQRIAIAHNSDDNIETAFLNLFRGSGVTGLRGMLPDTGEIIRPLLGISRMDIEAYLDENNETFVTDSSNLESEYKRNFIRNEIIPLVETRWPGVRKAISTTLENLRGEERVILWAEDELIPHGHLLPMQSIATAPDRLWIIRNFTKQFGTKRDIAVEICDVFEKRYGTQHIIGKKWMTGRGELRFSKKGLHYYPIGND